MSPDAGGVFLIDLALRLLANELDQGLRRHAAAADRLVVVSDLTDGAGAATAESAGRVVVSLVSIEREDVPNRAPRSFDGGQDRLGVRQAPVHVSLLVMVAANFSGTHYDEALKLIAGTIAFFQGKPLFTKANTPDLDPAFEQLSVEIQNLDITNQSNLWGILGGRYIPSVLYRIRLLAIDAGQLASQERRIEETRVSTLAGAG